MVHIWVKFHACLICSSRVFKFQIFSKKQKVSCKADFGWFLGYNSPEWGMIRLKSCLVIQQQVVNYICYAFYCTMKKWWQFRQKTDFLAHFWGFLVYTLLRPLYYAPTFCQMKGVMEKHNTGKFHQYSIFVVVKLCILKCFRGSRTYNFWLPLDGFWAITPLKEVQFAQNFDQ